MFIRKNYSFYLFKLLSSKVVWLRTISWVKSWLLWNIFINENKLIWSLEASNNEEFFIANDWILNGTFITIEPIDIGNTIDFIEGMHFCIVMNVKEIFEIRSRARLSNSNSFRSISLKSKNKILCILLRM